MLVNLLINIVLPILALRQLSDPDMLGPTGALIVAVAIPSAYFLWKWTKTNEANLFSVIGFVNVLVTGVIGLFELDHTLVFVKEASIPFIFATAIAVSEFTGQSLTQQLFGEFFYLKEIRAQYQDEGAGDKFNSQLRQTAFMLVFVFLVLVPANYALARYFVHSPSGTVEFNTELGRMMTWNFWLLTLPVAAVITVLVFRLIRQFREQTGLSAKEFMRPWQ